MHEPPCASELVQACKVLYAAKAVGDGLGGHLSARLDEHWILIKPRPVSWWKLEPKDLIVIDMAGVRVDQPGQPSGVRSGRFMLAFMPLGRMCSAYFHAHPSASTLMAALGIEMEPLDQDCASLTDRLPVLDNGAVSISTPALGNEVARALGAHSALLLKNHGCIVAGAGIAEVCVAAHKLEKARRQCCAPLPSPSCR